MAKRKQKQDSVALPSSPTDRDKLKTMLIEMTKCLRRIEDEKENQKSIGKEVKNLFGLTGKHVNKLVRTMYKQNFPEVQAENHAFEDLYQTVVDGAKGELTE